MNIRELYEREWLKQNPGRTLASMQSSGDFYYDDAAQAGWHWWQTAWEALQSAQRESDS
ncbi:hypothetical protein PSCICO_03950 [Pseudomonas cichorii]|nr:hypothetical protein PSCICO_03950 [Pseudomonas cichorii]